MAKRKNKRQAPQRVQAVQGLRGSGAAGDHGNRRVSRQGTRAASKRAAIAAERR